MQNLTPPPTQDAVYNAPIRVVDPLGVATEMSYDAATGNLVAVTADAGHFNASSRCTYTNTGQLLSATDPLGTVTLNAYDGFGNLVQVARDYGRLNQVSAMDYDARSDAIALTDPMGNVTRNAFDANRRLVSVTQPLASASADPIVTGLAYDADGRVVSTTRSAGASSTTTQATYTVSGQLATRTDANGNVTRYDYDVLDRLASVRDPLDRATSFTYDALSRRTGVYNTAIQANALLAQSYTPDGQLASVTDANANTTSYS